MCFHYLYSRNVVQTMQRWDILEIQYIRDTSHYYYYVYISFNPPSLCSGGGAPGHSPLYGGISVRPHSLDLQCFEQSQLFSGNILRGGPAQDSLHHQLHHVSKECHFFLRNLFCLTHFMRLYVFPLLGRLRVRSMSGRWMKKRKLGSSTTKQCLKGRRPDWSSKLQVTRWSLFSN